MGTTTTSEFLSIQIKRIMITFDVWYVAADGRLLYRDFTGTYEQCVSLVMARALGCWAIMESGYRPRRENSEK